MAEWSTAYDQLVRSPALVTDFISTTTSGSKLLALQGLSPQYSGVYAYQEGLKVSKTVLDVDLQFAVNRVWCIRSKGKGGEEDGDGEVFVFDMLDMRVTLFYKWANS